MFDGHPVGKNTTDCQKITDCTILFFDLLSIVISVNNYTHQIQFS